MRGLRPWLMAAALVGVAVARPVVAQQRSAKQSRPLDRANLDTTCAACTNFYQFANGGWIKANPIPAAFSRWGSFNELADDNTERLKQVLDDLAAGKGEVQNATTKKLGTFYATCMDSTRTDAQGAQPIASDLARIGALKSAADVQAEIARLHDAGVGVAFAFFAQQDAKQSSEMLAEVYQGGLGLPDRDYYLKPDSASAALRAAYVEHVARLLELTGAPATQAKADAERVMALETELARASMTRVEQRDPNAVYHKMTVAELQAAAPGMDWAAYLTRRNVAAKVPALNVAQPAFARAVGTLMTAQPLESWKAYLRWHVASEAAPYLSTAFVNENFRFQSQLTGAKELLPRYKRCITAADDKLGEALGQAYVARAFTPQAKARALEMVRNVQAVMRERLAGLEWMSDTTRRQAIAKLEAFVDKIGYPDRWRDYSALEVRGDAFVLDARRADHFATRRNLNKLGKPVDRGEWGMSPPTVNAYYNPAMNEIVFPAGILQPPFFDPHADDAVNYGGMGAVIGHEITHGFDDQGRQYDAQGNLRDWWTKEDATRFTARAQRVVDQFDHYTVLDSATKVNGKLTLGENIADLGGLTIAYYALQKSMEGKPRPANIDGFTPEQRFFLAWAQIWRQNTRPEYARMLINVDPHAPGVWRTNGPLSNMPEFAKAWGCKAGDPMVRGDEQRAQIW